MRLMVRSRDDVTTGRLQPLQQAAIRFTTSHDRVRLAWTASGSGLPMLKAPSWISNIELEACSLIFTEFYRWLGERVQLVRFDQRGTSLSDRVEGILRIDDMVEDMRAVADAAGLERFLLFGRHKALPLRLPLHTAIRSGYWALSARADSGVAGSPVVKKVNAANTGAAKP
ncbi:MAG TPA: hypothetical protein PLN94_06910 [Thiolinea sp.]|nr:hypothetical protein [Thiolinea sp.]